MSEHNVYAIAGAFQFFIERGEPGSEDALIEALNKSGNLNLAYALLGCGNLKLEREANRWLTKNRVPMMVLGNFVWGSKR